MSGAGVALVACLAGAAAALLLRAPASVGDPVRARRLLRWSVLLVPLIPIVFPGKAVVAAVLSLGGVA